MTSKIVDFESHKAWAKAKQNAYHKAYMSLDPSAMGNWAEEWGGSFQGDAPMNRGQKKAWSDEYKVSLGCAHCGYNKHPAALDYHHPGEDRRRDHSKLISQGIGGWSFKRLKATVEECAVLCANCHRIEHHTPGTVQSDKCKGPVKQSFKTVA